MPYRFNPFTANFDYYVAGGAVADGPFDYMSGTDVEFMDGNAVDYMGS